MPTLSGHNARGIKKYTTTNQNRPAANSAYHLPSIEDLVPDIHAASGFPVKSTRLKEIKKGNFESWTGLTYNNAAKYCPHTVETLKGHMLQSSKRVGSTKKKKHQTHNNKNKQTRSTL